MRMLLNAQQIHQTIVALTERLLADPLLKDASAGDLALVGILSRGELIAERIAAEARTRGLAMPVGALDITMYRDDLDHRGVVVIPQGTNMNFRLDDRTVILVDDVLATGRSARAALDAVVDFGRPKRIRLLTLVDRGGREFPIAADYVGIKADPPDDQQVYVRLRPTDPEDVVYMDSKPASKPPASLPSPRTEDSR